MPRKQPFPYIERDPKGGETYYYLRRPGFPRVRIPGPYGGLEFRRAYDEALMQRAPSPIGATRTVPGSMSALIVSFYRSAQFQNLKASTATRAPPECRRSTFARSSTRRQGRMRESDC